MEKMQFSKSEVIRLNTFAFQMAILFTLLLYFIFTTKK